MPPPMVKCAIPHEECRRGAYLPSLGLSLQVDKPLKSVRRQTYGYLPSRRAPPPLYRYRMLPGDRGVRV